MEETPLGSLPEPIKGICVLEPEASNIDYLDPLGQKRQM